MDDVPYVMALVQLREGPTLLAGLKGCSPGDVEIGAAVAVEFERRSDTIQVPYFSCPPEVEHLHRQDDERGRGTLSV